MSQDVTTTPSLDPGLVDGFGQHLAGIVTGGATTAMLVLGDRAGLYSALADGEPCTPAELAARSGTTERCVAEWLAQQSAAGILTHEPTTGRYRLPPEHAALLGGPGSPVDMLGAALTVTGMHGRIDALAASFRSGTGLPWGEQDEATFEATERFWGSIYRSSLVSDWIPALDRVGGQLAAGALVADVGCGRGVALIEMARAFPESRFVGYDVHEPSLEHARGQAVAADVADRVEFRTAHCHGYPAEGYDVIWFFDAFHDLGDPVGAAAHARSALTDDGTLVLVEPLAEDDLAANLVSPAAALNYAASTSLCTANALSQPVGQALGAQAGEQRLREVLAEGGFTRVRRAAEGRFNLVLEAR